MRLLMCNVNHFAGTGHVGQLFSDLDTGLMHHAIVVDQLDEVILVPVVAYDAQAVGCDE